MSFLPSNLAIILALSLLFISGESGLLDDLSDDLQHYQIFSSFLSLKERVRCIAPLNRKCNNYYNHAHGKQMQEMKQLEQWFNPPQTTSHLNEIRDLMESLKFSELFSLHLPTLLTQLNEQWDNFSISNEYLVQTLHAMELQPLGMDELMHNLTSLPCPLPLLLLSSRALINHYIPNYFANSDIIKQNDTMIGLSHSGDGTDAIDSFLYWTNFPWLRPNTSDALCMFQTEHWVHYLTYLYEFCFGRITHGSLHSLFHLDGSTRDMFKILIEKYGFIAWNKASIDAARRRFALCNLFEIYTDFVRIERTMNLSSAWHTNYSVPFRMYLVLNLYEQDGCIDGVDVFQRGELKSHMLSLYFESWTNVERGKEKLLQMLISMYDDNDEAVFDILEPHYNNTSFRNNFLYALWCSGKPVYFDRDSKIQRLITDAIISRIT
eukprot:134791_1